MKIECTRDSKWGNPRNGGSQTFKKGQVLVCGEDVKESRAEDMLRCDYAVKVGDTEVKETKDNKGEKDEKTVKGKAEAETKDNKKGTTK
jgi:hypothetical protein